MKTIISNNIEEFISGIKEVCALVESTYGPLGANVAVAGGADRAIFDDGAKVISRLFPEGSMKQEAVFRIRDAANATVRDCGDGTSTTTILLASLLEAGIYLVDSDDIRRKAVSDAFAILGKWVEKEISSVEDITMSEKNLKAVATIAMHGDKTLGDLIGGMVHELGPDAIVTAEISADKKYAVRTSQGYTWKGKVLDPAFLNAGATMRYEDALVLVVNETLSTIVKERFWADVFSAWKRVSDEEREKALIVVCAGAEGSVLSTFVGNVKQNGAKMAIVSAPGEDLDRSMMMQDLAEYLGTKVFEDRTGVMKSSFKPEDFGRAKKIVVGAKGASVEISDGDLPSKIAAKIEEMYEEQKESAAAMEQKKRRTANVFGATGIVYVPAMSETELAAMREVIEDGYRAAISAFEGIVPGASVVLRTIADRLFLVSEDEDAAQHILPLLNIRPGERRAIISNFAGAILRPFQTLFSKCGDNLLGRISYPQTVNMVTGEVCDAEEFGIFDTKKVLTASVRNALSVAIPLINTEYFIIEQYDF